MALLNVLIYCGAGICQFSMNQTFKTLRRFLKNSYDVKMVDLNTLSNANIPWEADCALFVMPGGRDCPYMKDFTEQAVIPRIKTAISSGKMKYLGICAGAYFASDRIEFELGRAGYEVCQDRPLKLIDGVAKGPLPGKSFYYSDDPMGEKSQMHAITIEGESTGLLKVAYNGGCYFPETRENVLSQYNEPDMHNPAIILQDESFCLSGVHFEYDPMDCLSESQCTAEVFSELLAFNDQRVNLVMTILRRLGLAVHDSFTSDESLSSIQIQVKNANVLNSVLLNNKSVQFHEPTSAFYETFSEKCPDVLLLHAHIVTSTQTVLIEEPRLLDALPDFSLFLADHQVSGRGRGKNYWISSPACLQFTLKVEHPSNASHRLPCLQFIMSIALAECINRSTSLRPGLSARIKWPNDIYLSSASDGIIGKIAGIIVNCSNSVERSVNHVLIGVGVNLFSDPNLPNITHLSDYLVDSSSIIKEDFLSELVLRFRHLYSQFLLTDQFPFTDYYALWLHSNQSIQIAENVNSSENVPVETCRIRGIDEFGYLVGVNEHGLKVKFEPDGNSFDMMKNLLKRK